MLKVWKELKTQGFAKLDIDKELWNIQKFVFLGHIQKFKEDGAYLTKWTLIGKGREFPKITINEAEDVLPFLEDIKALKPKIVNRLFIPFLVVVPEELIQ